MAMVHSYLTYVTGVCVPIQRWFVARTTDPKRRSQTAWCFGTCFISPNQIGDDDPIWTPTSKHVHNVFSGVNQCGLSQLEMNAAPDDQFWLSCSPLMESDSLRIDWFLTLQLFCIMNSHKSLRERMISNRWCNSGQYWILCWNWS